MKDIDIIPEPRKDLTKVIENVFREKELPKYWDRVYINAKIAEETNHTYKMLFMMLWLTGVRISECLSIRKQDLDFKNNMIHIPWLKNRKYKDRRIPMHPLLKMPLALFTAKINGPNKIFRFNRNTAYIAVNKRFGGSPHQFRHSFAVNWLNCKGDLVILHKILGHRQIQTTMEYLKIVPVDQEKELLKIDFI